MPRKARSRKMSSLSKKQKMEVRRIAEKVVDEEIEDKAQVVIIEKQELFHNKPIYYGKLLGSIAQGVQDGDQSTGSLGSTEVRIGDQISLKNVNLRFWLSNKGDRPNVMYKGVLYWYPQGIIPSDAEVFKTQSNKMLDRYNNKVIRVVDTFILNSTFNYAVTPGKEKSYLATLNKSYKNKKISYDINTVRAKGWDLGFAVVCYDAYGTLQTDNIASFAVSTQITFQDA